MIKNNSCKTDNLKIQKAINVNKANNLTEGILDIGTAFTGEKYNLGDAYESFKKLNSRRVPLCHSKLNGIGSDI